MAGKLILSLDGSVVKEYDITGKTLTIGRKHDNDIQLNDMTVSGRHARISVVPGFVFVEDLDSTNGTLVNGYHINKVALEHGNVIQIGHHQFTYLAPGKSKYEPTMFIKAELDETQMALPAWDLEPEISSAGGQPLAVLQVLNGPMAGTTVELRKACSSLGLNGKKLALISRGINAYTIAVSPPRSPGAVPEVVLLNGSPLPADPIRLNPNDVITITGFDIEFRHLESSR
jgi:hypothetical protein